MMIFTFQVTLGLMIGLFSLGHHAMIFGNLQTVGEPTRDEPGGG